MPEFYSTPDFEAAYTYRGNDLGVVLTKDSTAFRLWAPLADAVTINFYQTGDPDAQDLMYTKEMERDVSGTWVCRCIGSLHGVYYTYLVTHEGHTVEVCDPYARTTGVNGHRAMVIDLSTTDPEGWAEDKDPNAGIAVTDAVIYELHVRDMSVDESSGIRQKGKYLGIVEPGTTTPSGIPTGLDHMKALGITHLHLLPVYDYGSVDERYPEKNQFNWGYDPVNFNVPEGSYSSDPFHGEVRVRELKQLIKGLHDNGISAVMDVVYNHVYEAKDFCFNKIVPNYFSRMTKGVYSNGSGCGNDTASERSMVHKYIVDSVCYWADEYHFDGFRFDLVGLLDVDTINEIVSEVHKRHPNVIFYGEGWSLDTVLTKPCLLAVQSNAKLTPGFAYFSDNIRDALRGSVFISDALGFVTGEKATELGLESSFSGMPEWCPAPTQTVNYVSCHDNNTLYDRIALATPKETFEGRVGMNKLAAAFCLTAQGIPFMQAGEEMLRSKPDGKGDFVENSYCSSDEVNSIKWNLLDKAIHRDTVEYYKGLIAFRKAHPALRMTKASDVCANLKSVPCSNAHVLAFSLTGNVPGESAEELYFIFNADKTAQTMKLPAGNWEVQIDGNHAGTTCIRKVSGSVKVSPVSAMVLVKNK